MPENMIKSAVTETKRKFEAAKAQLESRNGLLASKVDAVVGNMDDLLRAREVVRKSGEYISDFCDQCNALLLALDAVCRPYLDQNPDIRYVGEVVRLMDEILCEMRKSYTSFGLSINGVHSGNLGTIHAQASAEVQAIHELWDLRYRAMPGYYAEQQRVRQQAKKDKEAELAYMDDLVKAALESVPWIQIDDIEIETGMERKEIGRALNRLKAQGTVIRHDFDGDVYFAIAGTPIPEYLQKKEEEPVPEIKTPEPEAEIPASEPTFTETPEKPKKSKTLPILILSLILAVALAVAGVFVYQNIQNKALEQQKIEEAQRMEYLKGVLNAAVKQAKTAIANGETNAIAFDADTKNALAELGIRNVFETEEVRLCIAEQLSSLYRKNDFGQVVNLLAFLKRNHAASFLTTGEIYDICLSEEYLSDFEAYVLENGTFVGDNGIGRNVYTYQTFEIGFSNRDEKDPGKLCYVKVEDDSAIGYDYVIIGDPTYRFQNHVKSGTETPGYILVGTTVSSVVEEIPKK